MKRNKLSDMEYDEISLVGRPANQDSLVSFAKSATLEDSVEEDLYDETGAPVDVDELEPGDVVYTNDGQAFEFVIEDDDDDDDEEVGKAMWDKPMRTAKVAFKAGQRGRTMDYVNSPIVRAANFAGRKPKQAAAMGAAGVAATGAGAGYAMSKSSTVLEDLSKALTDADRDVVVTKALADAEARADRAERIAKAAAEELMYAQDERLTEAYISKAAEYNLPVNPEVLGPILKSVAEVLSEDELDILDQLFSAIGDDIYREVGYVGGSSNVFDEIEATANQLVGKSDLTHEQAIVALLESNPDAYVAYNAERGAL